MKSLVVDGVLKQVNPSDIKFGVIKINKNVIEIDSSACKNQKVTKVVLPKFLEKIGNDAFYGCDQLKKIEIPKNVVEIGAGAFNNCQKLQIFVLNDNLTKIGPSAFAMCKSLTEITIPAGLKNIPDEMCGRCSNLKEVNFNYGLQSIGNNAFTDCYELQVLTFPKGLTNIGSRAFYNCTNIKQITFDEGLKNISSQAFVGCGNVTELKFPKSLESIGEGAFGNCEFLEKIEIQSNLKSIGKNAFSECYNLKQVVMNGTIINLTRDMAVNFDLYYNFLRYAIENNKFIPKNIGIVKYMDEKTIPIFYSKSKDWQAVLNAYVNKWEGRLNFLGPTGKNNAIENLFKISFALGILEEGESAIIAKEFVLNQITKLSPKDLRERFDELNTREIGFNEEFARFFIKNYRDETEKGKRFLEQGVATETGDIEVKNYTSKIYNNWKKIKNTFPNKSVFADRERGSENNNLTEVDVINVFSTVKYKNVHLECETLAKLCGQYGYNQTQFEELQSIFEQSKKIKPNEMILKIKPDEKNKNISYKFLQKGSLDALFLGEQTNCCQKINDGGAGCIKYGATKPNSGFISFYCGDKLIGQSWVWYNEKNGVVCLDNIEVPLIWQKQLKKQEFKHEFISCIKRLAGSIKQEMEKNGNHVLVVTIGAGHNDLPGIEEFKTLDVKNKKLLPDDYKEYTDANELMYIVEKFKENIALNAELII